MIGWLIFAAYVVGWFPAAVKATRVIAGFPRCHGEGSYRWGWSRHSCLRFDPKGCWRSGSVSLPAVLIGVGLAFIWPASILVGAVYFAANNGPVAPTRLLSEADLDRMERDLGIGGKS